MENGECLGSLTLRTRISPKVSCTPIGNGDPKKPKKGSWWLWGDTGGLHTLPLAQCCWVSHKASEVRLPPGSHQRLWLRRQALGASVDRYWSEMAWMELGGQGAASAGWDVLVCQKVLINSMPLAKAGESADGRGSSVLPEATATGSFWDGLGVGREKPPWQARTFGGLCGTCMADRLQNNQGLP